MRRVSLGVAIVAAGLAACAEEDGPAEPAGPDPILADDFPAAFAHAYCDGLAQCCSSAGLAHDGAACITSMTAEGQHLLDQAPPLRKYDPVGAGQCIVNLKALWPTCQILPAAEGKAKEACEEVFTGTVAVGGACQSDHDCVESSQGPVHCEVNVNMPVPPAPICVVDPPGKLDEPCIGSAPYDPATPFPHLKCEDSLYCDRDINRCRQRHGEGEDCNPSMQCESTLWCHGTGPTSGACEKTAALGAPCTFGGQCTSGLCHQDVCSDGIPLDAVKCAGP